MFRLTQLVSLLNSKWYYFSGQILSSTLVTWEVKAFSVDYIFQVMGRCDNQAREGESHLSFLYFPLFLPLFFFINQKSIQFRFIMKNLEVKLLISPSTLLPNSTKFWYVTLRQVCFGTRFVCMKYTGECLGDHYLSGSKGGKNGKREELSYCDNGFNHGAGSFGMRIALQSCSTLKEVLAHYPPYHWQQLSPQEKVLILARWLSKADLGRSGRPIS